MSSSFGQPRALYLLVLRNKVMFRQAICIQVGRSFFKTTMETSQPSLPLHGALDLLELGTLHSPSHMQRKRERSEFSHIRMKNFCHNVAAGEKLRCEDSAERSVAMNKWLRMQTGGSINATQRMMDVFCVTSLGTSLRSKHNRCGVPWHVAAQSGSLLFAITHI